MADAMELSERVFDMICGSSLVADLEDWFDAHPDTDVNLYRDEVGRHALHEASRRGRARSVRVLIDHGADINARDEHEQTSLMRACVSFCSECVQVLIEAKSDLNATDENGLSAIHHASCNHVSSVESLQLLLDEGVDVNAIDGQGRTALIAACEYYGDQSGNVQVLIEGKADLIATDNVGRSAIHYASERNLQLLIENHVDINARDAHEMTPLMIACESFRGNSVDRIQVLIEAKADLNAADHVGESAIHYYQQKVLTCYDNINKWLNCLQLLLDNHADVNARDRNEMTLLKKACGSRHDPVEWAQALIEAKADVNATYRLSATAVHASFRNPKCLQLLIDNRADVNATDDVGRNVTQQFLLIFKPGGNLECLQLLLDSGVDANTRDKEDKTLLMIACASSSDPVDCAQLLINAKADLLATDRTGQSAIHYASVRNLNCLQLLIDNHADVNTRDKKDKTLLMSACASRHDPVDCAQLLINANADLFAIDRAGQSAIHYASERNLNCLQLLIDNHADVNARDKNGITSLMSACASSRDPVDCAQLLINAKADLFAIDRTGQSAIHHASVRNCLQLLIDNHADVNARDEFEKTPLITACEHYTGPADCVHLLLDAKADLNAEDMDGDTAILACASSPYRLKCLQVLLDNGVDVNVCKGGGYTPAMMSCIVGVLPSLQLLIKNKADLNVYNSLNRGVLVEAMASHARSPGVAFAVLCCNTDAKNVAIDGDDYGHYHEDEDEDEDEEIFDCSVTEAKVAACIEEYKHIHAYIDEYHCILTDTLSTKVEVDTRVGLRDNGIYQEPLERTLEYFGLSMKQDQVVNTSIDRGTKRALIPFHVLNAKVWHDKYQAR